MVDEHRGLGGTKKTVFFGLLALGMIAVLEGASSLALTIRDGRLPSLTLWRQQREKVTQETGGATGGGSRANGGIGARGMEVIHPYVGFVLNPPFKVDWRDVNSQGFLMLPGEVEPPASVPRFVVAVFGGSVAAGFCLRRGRAAFLHELQRSPSVQGKAIVVHCFAMGGYKQPQQLMALNYALSLGETIDLAINLDGLNEVALPIAEHLKEGIYPFYPRGWSARVAGAPSVAALRIIGQIALWTDERLRR